MDAADSIILALFALVDLYLLVQLRIMHTKQARARRMMASLQLAIRRETDPALSTRQV